MTPLLGARKSVNAMGLSSNGVVDGVGGGGGDDGGGDCDQETAICNGDNILWI
jgi:hypothetical protein